MSVVQSDASSAIHNFCPVRETWTVSYQLNGRDCLGTVLGFSEAGWHIAGEMPVYQGATVTLQVHRPNRTATVRIPSVRVQAVDGSIFAVRVDVAPEKVRSAVDALRY